MDRETLEHALPPPNEVRDIVLDMMSVISPGADQLQVARSVMLAEQLIGLLQIALEDPVSIAVMGKMLTGVAGGQIVFLLPDC